MLTIRVHPPCGKVQRLDEIKCSTLGKVQTDCTQFQFTILRRFLWVYLDGQSLKIVSSQPFCRRFSARNERDSFVLNFDSSVSYIIIIFSFTTSSSSHKVYNYIHIRHYTTVLLHFALVPFEYTHFKMIIVGFAYS